MNIKIKMWLLNTAVCKRCLPVQKSPAVLNASQLINFKIWFIILTNYSKF